MTARPIAVTGASGNIGSAVVQGLVGAGEADVVALVRRTARFSESPSSVTVRVADYADVAAFTKALAGVPTLVFISSDGEAAPMLVHHMNVVDAAVRAGVERIIYLSILDVDAESPFCYALVHRRTEQMLQACGISHTVLRASIYGDFFGRWIREAATTGILSLPTGTGRLSLVSRSDVAQCLVAATRQGPSGPHLVTGARAYDLQELARLSQQLAQAPVRAEDIAPAQFCARLLRDRVSPWWSYAFTSMFESIAEHRFESVTEAVFTLTHRAPVPFIETARRALAER